MRVLAVTNMYPTPENPSMGTFVERQVQGLRRIGLDVDVLCIQRSERGRGVYYQLGQTVQANIKKFNPDVVHAMYGGIMAERITRIVSDRPVVVSFCGTDLLGGTFFNFLKRVTVRLNVYASHLAARRAAAIIVKSNNLKNALPSHINRNKVRIIPNGVDLEVFRPLGRTEACKKLGWNPEEFHMLFTDRTSRPRKRIELAQAAMDILLKKGIPARLQPLTGVAHQEVPWWLNACNVLVLTSFLEGSPNVVKEALACNRPVVSMDVGDVRERIEGIEGCYLSPPHPEALAETLIKVYNGPASVEGRKVVADLSVENIAYKIQNVYSRVLHADRSALLWSTA